MNAPYAGEKADVSAHTFGEWNITKEATATEAGQQRESLFCMRLSSCRGNPCNR